jgi:hypothetical protein
MAWPHMPIRPFDQAMATLIDLEWPIRIRMRGEFLGATNGGIKVFRDARAGLSQRLRNGVEQAGRHLLERR